MLPVFCLRLAFGLLASLLLLSPAQVNPRYFRTQFLIALALGALSLILSHELTQQIAALVTLLFLTFLGSAIWSIAGHPGGRQHLLVTICVAGMALGFTAVDEGYSIPDELLNNGDWLIGDNVVSAWFLGGATTTMLLGHFYLITPGMSLTPLRRLLVGLFIVFGLRAIMAGLTLWLWTRAPAAGNLADVAWMWLPLRWGFGLLLPAVLSIMAWKTLNVPNTQSATGILYIVVVFCFLGELTSLLLLRTTGYPL